LTSQPEQLTALGRTWATLAPALSIQTRASLGQYKTPAGVAQFMAALFTNTGGECRLLDAGAGIGTLTCAVLDRWAAGPFDFSAVDVTAYEIDDQLREHLAKHLSAYQGIQSNVLAGDFIELATQEYLWGGSGFTHAILNPPYKKIGAHSQHRLLLRCSGIETVNLYSAFVALAVALAAEGGQIVALIPRSFCNGPYYRPFRKFILQRAAIKQIHLFDSRRSAFKNDGVLQENVILHLERGGQPGPVTVSTSTDDSFADLVAYQYPIERIVFPEDLERFIHIPTISAVSESEQTDRLNCTLADLGVNVSTGPVVDFRLKVHLRSMPEAQTVPLLYPVHLAGNIVTWPISGARKPNAIQRNAETEKWLYPTGFYCAVKRFSSKEEQRRISATVIDPACFAGAEQLGFENHLNIIHDHKRGLPAVLAHGLAAYLNSTSVDEQFRRFNGHTQVNATDLKNMNYPSREVLMRLGEWMMGQPDWTQAQLDAQLQELTR
jgi:adenine-specific DNA-methyltransferase